MPENDPKPAPADELIIPLDDSKPEPKTEPCLLYTSPSPRD